MAGRCDQCGAEEYMPYVCKFCKGKFCAAHRLPENHGCQGLGAYRERVRAEGRVFAPEQQAPMTPRVSTTARAGASMDAVWSRLDGKMTYVFMGVILAVYLLEFLVLATAGGSTFDMIFPVDQDFLTKPWTIVVSVFAHDPFYLNHILFNVIALLFFGNAVEKLIGTRRFTYLFLAAGAVAGIAQVIWTVVIWGQEGGTVGASGAIQGIMGALVILAPTLTVLVFFVIPAPLWAITALYVVLDLAGAITPGSRVAHVAHLAGLATGILFGYRMRQKGMRVVQRPPEMRPRF